MGLDLDPFGFKDRRQLPPQVAGQDELPGLVREVGSVDLGQLGGEAPAAGIAAVEDSLGPSSRIAISAKPLVGSEPARSIADLLVRAGWPGYEFPDSPGVAADRWGRWGVAWPAPRGRSGSTRRG